jgi:hypothetical protein
MKEKMKNRTAQSKDVRRKAAWASFGRPLRDSETGKQTKIAYRVAGKQ